MTCFERLAVVAVLETTVATRQRHEVIAIIQGRGECGLDLSGSNGRGAQFRLLAYSEGRFCDRLDLGYEEAPGRTVTIY